MAILPLQKGLEIPGGGGSRRPTNLKKCLKFNWNLQRGGELLKKSLLWGRHGYFRNYTLKKTVDNMLLTSFTLFQEPQTIFASSLFQFLFTSFCAMKTGRKQFGKTNR